MRRTTRPPAVGTMISEVTGPGIVRILRRGGFGFAIVDCEHGPFTLADLAVMAAVAADTPFRLYVRVPSATREHIGRVLDLGADGIVVPMVDTAAQAAEAVRPAAYAPAGERGVSVTRAHSGYGVADLPAYLAQANERVRVYLQLETPGAVERAEEIASVAGVSGVVVGPNDLLQALGVPGQLDHPALDAALATVARAARSAGVESGLITSRPSLLARGASLGMTFLSLDSELGHLLRGARAALKAFEQDADAVP